MRFRVFLIYIVVLISIVGYVPYIYTGGFYSICRLILLGTMGLLIAITVFNTKHSLDTNFFKSLFCLLTLLGVLFLSFYAFGLNLQLSDLIQVAIPIFGTYVAYNMKMSQATITHLIWFYVLVAVVVAGLSINTYMGVSNDSNPYLIEGKNQVGAIISIATGLAFYLSCTSSGPGKIIGFACFGISLVFGLMIECRTAFIGSLLCVAYTTYKTSTKNQLAIILTIAFITCVILFDQIYALFIDFLIGDRVVLNANDLSTGRMERNVAAFEFISHHPLDGELKTLSHIPLIHNYILLKLVRYGIFAIPFICVYFLYLIVAVKDLVKTKIIKDIAKVGFIILIIPFFNSLLEPGAPFGPGSVFVFCYMLFGYSLNAIQPSK